MTTGTPPRAALFGGYSPCPLQFVVPGVRREERLWISGPRGSGRTTVWRALLSGVGLPPQRVLQLGQELDAASVEAARACAKSVLAEAFCARLGLAAGAFAEPLPADPAVLLRVALAAGLSRHPWLVALDEPAAHLDAASAALVEAVLREYPGALVLVSSDARFAKALTTRELCCGGAEAPRPAVRGS